MGTLDSDKKSKRDDRSVADAESGEDGVASTSSRDGVAEGEDKLVVRVGEEVGEAGSGSLQLGSTRYVLAAFFAAGITAAYVFGRTVYAAWSKLAYAQAVVDVAPWVTYSGEDARDTWSMIIGGVLAICVVVYVYRRNDIRTWVNEAAGELAKVAWPSKDEVINGTVVVVVASLVATFYLTLLDRFWGFVTDLVYR